MDVHAEVPLQASCSKATDCVCSTAMTCPTTYWVWGPGQQCTKSLRRGTELIAAARARRCCCCAAPAASHRACNLYSRPKQPNPMHVSILCLDICPLAMTSCILLRCLLQHLPSSSSSVSCAYYHCSERCGSCLHLTWQRFDRDPASTSHHHSFPCCM